MIVVRFTSEAMHVEGHATRGKKARYQVCAAVSVLMIGLRILMDERHKLGVVPFAEWGPEASFALFVLIRLFNEHPGNIRLEPIPPCLLPKLKTPRRKRR